MTTYETTGEIEGFTRGQGDVAAPRSDGGTEGAPLTHDIAYVPTRTLFREALGSEGAWAAIEGNRIIYTNCALESWFISDNGGQHWEDQGPFVDRQGAVFTGFGPSLLRLQSGPLGLIYAAGPNVWDLLLFRQSDDEGRTWSEPNVIHDARDGQISAILHNAAIVTDSGRIVAPVYTRTGRRDYFPPKDYVGRTAALQGDEWTGVGSHGHEPHPLVCWVYYSDDDGKTWHRNANGQMAITLGFEAGGSHSCEEPVVAETRPGHLLMIYRTALGRLFQSWSFDNGTNWTQPRPTALAACRAPAQLARIPGTHELVLMWNQASGDEIERGLQRHRLTIAVSDDHGASWKHHKNLVCLGPNDPSHVEPPPIRYYRAEQFSPRLPGNTHRCAYPSMTIWRDRLIFTYLHYAGPWHDNDGEVTRPREWATFVMALPLSYVRQAEDRPRRVDGRKREGLRNARASDPDFVVYVPPPGEVAERENQHFLVTPTRSGNFLAIWTQAVGEAAPGQHVVISRSTDRGHTWSEPAELAPYPSRPEHEIASWGFPVVVPHTKRIYVFYNQNTGSVANRRDMTAEMAYRWSDDDGVTWSQQVHSLRIPKSAMSDPDPEALENWVVYQSPIITRRGEVMVGFSRFSPKQGKNYLFDNGCEVWFLRFDNILTETDPSRLTITVFPEADHGLAVPWPEHPQVSCAQEPTIQDLGDGRMICVIRTATGFVHYSLSEDGGRSWDPPRPLRFGPDGPRIPQPVCPCPLYKLRDGRFILIFHNNEGYANGGSGPGDSAVNRRPAFLTVGREIGHPDHPLMFTEPRFLADNGAIVDGPDKTEICTYTSFFEHGNQAYLWYPDRKHYLLGKVLPTELLDDAWLP